MRDRVLVVDDEIGMRAALDASLRRAGWNVETAAGVKEALRKLQALRPALVITDMRMPDGDGLDVMRAVRRMDTSIPVILLTAYGSIPEAVEAVKAGACNYLVKPVSMQHLQECVAALVKRERESTGDGGFIGTSAGLVRALELATMAARTTADVLIEAESGTGKELLARYIHQHSDQRGGPFVAVNCAAVPETLLESELFGHARGAFTGALAAKKGKFELANGGTLLLDEIGEMPMSLQPKLLRVLQERKVEPLGEVQPVAVDVRVIATTNRSLSELVQQGCFRADLYFRLNVIPLTLPPLRERAEDIAELARHFARTFGAGGAAELSEEFIAELEQYSWPGNVRELANTVHRAIALGEGRSVRPAFLCRGGVDPQRGFRPESAGLTRAEVERRHFATTLTQMKGNRTRTAEALGVSVRTVRNMIRRYGLAQEMPA